MSVAFRTQFPCGCSHEQGAWVLCARHRAAGVTPEEQDAIEEWLHAQYRNGGDMSVARNLERDLRHVLHQDLDTVLDSANEAGERVVDVILRSMENGHVATVSVHTMPKPADVPAGP